jgi:hypothetical protein
MKLRIELDREVDGRWIAEVPQLNVILYGDSRQDAIQKAQVAARESYLIGSLTRNCLRIRRTQCSTLQLELLALNKGPARVRCSAANRLAP